MTSFVKIAALALVLCRVESLTAAIVCEESPLNRVFVNYLLRARKQFDTNSVMILRTFETGRLKGVTAEGVATILIANKPELRSVSLLNCRGGTFPACLPKEELGLNDATSSELLTGNIRKVPSRTEDQLVTEECVYSKKNSTGWEVSPPGREKTLILREVVDYLRQIDPAGESVKRCEVFDFNILDLSLEAVVTWKEKDGVLNQYLYSFQLNPLGQPRVGMFRSDSHRKADHEEGPTIVVFP